MTEEIKKTCLYDRHVALEAQMSPFAGFIMPIQYTGIVDEHNAVRNSCGVFDVSHMGEVFVEGPDAERYVNHIFTNDVTGMPVGKILYGMMLYDNGGTVDDLLVYRLAPQQFLLVINAANIEKDVAWINERVNDACFDIKIDHASDRFGQIAVQGPDSEAVLHDVLGIDGEQLAFYTATTIFADNGEEIIVSRTGYTGEDGFEIYASPAVICDFWDELIKSGRATPCGLGCRDTLRFEVGLPLYGDELSADISPIEAGLGMFVKVDKEEFVGKDAVARQKAEGVERKLVGLELSDRAIPRHGYAVLNLDGQPIGEITTGYHAISVDKSVAMAFVKRDYTALDTEVLVQIRRRTFLAKVVRKQFYKKSYKK